MGNKVYNSLAVLNLRYILSIQGHKILGFIMNLNDTITSARSMSYIYHRFYDWRSTHKNALDGRNSESKMAAIIIDKNLEEIIFFRLHCYKIILKG